MVQYTGRRNVKYLPKVFAQPEDITLYLPFISGQPFSLLQAPCVSCKCTTYRSCLLSQTPLKPLLLNSRHPYFHRDPVARRKRQSHEVASILGLEIASTPAGDITMETKRTSVFIR